jgi:hypothetical protein
VKTNPKAFLLHLLVCGFSGDPAALYVGTVSRRKRGFGAVSGSKAMILFAPHLMAAEPWLQSDRETQKLDIYFTDYTLTEQTEAYSS